MQIIPYILKLSVCLAACWIFYQLVLRRLTFYTWNRWYLLAGSLLALVLPLVNIYPVLEENELAENAVLSAIPSFPVTNDADHYTATERVVQEGTGIADIVVYVLAAGVVVMLVKLIIQFVSLMRMRRAATLLLSGPVKVYQVNKPVIPFSFGNAIYVNVHQHDEAALKEIIRHEFIHVKQRHTIDIIWSELLCVLAWYNPFAWLLRQAIRQNLEFIADQQVLQSGLDKKQYQYLLLRVVGINDFSIASNFNFSSLKKRIAMMNKSKSARVHLARFLLLLPVLAIILLAFRQNRAAVDVAATAAVSETNQEKRAHIVGADDPIPTVASDPVESLRPQSSRVDAAVPTTITDTMPKKALPADVISVQVTNNQAIVTLKNGKTEIYNLDNADDKAAFVKKYGKLRMPPAPPKPPASGRKEVPVPPTPPPPPGTSVQEAAVAPGTPAVPPAKAWARVAEGTPASTAPPVTPTDGEESSTPAATAGTPVPPASSEQPTAPAPPPAARAGYHMPDDVTSAHIGNNKATITFKTGRKEEYDFSDPAQKAAFDRKYQLKPR